MRAIERVLTVVKLIVKLGISCLLFLITVEICARIDDYLRFDAPFFGSYSSDHLRKIDSNGKQYNVPNARFEKWQHNGFGFRGAEITLYKPVGTTRVVCMGSSESYGLYESLNNEWPAQLQKKLPMPNWQIINASVVGIDLSGYKNYISQNVLKFSPDLVIVVVNPYRYATVFERSQSKSTANSVSSPSVKEPPATEPLSKILHGLRSYPKIKQATKGFIGKSFPSILQGFQLKAMDSQIKEAEKLRLKGKTPKDKISSGCVDDYRKDIVELISFLKSHGIQVLLTSYPTLLDSSNIDKYREIFLDNRRFSVEFSLNGMVDVREKLNQVMAEVAASEGTLFVDACMCVPRDLQHFSDNVHYTDSGAHLIAEAVAEALQSVSTSHPNLH